MNDDTSMEGRIASTEPLWKSQAQPRTPLTQRELRVDVCIIGAGISGLSAAHALASEGRRVLVLDDGPLGGGETHRTSAHLASCLDDGFVRLESLFGVEGARLAAESHTAAIDRIEWICSREGIACDFKRVDGYLFAGETASEEDLERELFAARRAGLLDVQMVERAPLPHFDSGPALLAPRQAQFDPMAYVEGLAVAIERRGGLIATPHHVSNVRQQGEMVMVDTDDGVLIIADYAIVATNAPITNAVGLPLKQAAYRSYAVAVDVPKRTLPLGLYWDMEEPYHYARVVEGQSDSETDVVIVGGEDHKTGQADDAHERYARLEAWTRAHIGPYLAVTARWSGQVMEPFDALGYIGPAHNGSERILVITGDSGHGLTHATIGAMVVSDLIGGRSNPWQELYSPRRAKLKATSEFLKETVNTAARYSDWVRAGDVDSVDRIEPGHGAVVRRGLSLIAAYRDDEGQLHECSAMCRHLGGVVQWNDAEKSWDCPCHGARYDAHGRVMNGPANEDLLPAHAEEKAARRAG